MHLVVFVHNRQKLNKTKKFIKNLIKVKKKHKIKILYSCKSKNFTTLDGFFVFNKSKTSL